MESGEHHLVWASQSAWECQSVSQSELAFEERLLGLESSLELLSSSVAALLDPADWQRYNKYSFF